MALTGTTSTRLSDTGENTSVSLSGSGSHDLKTMAKVLNVKIASMRSWFLNPLTIAGWVELDGERLGPEAIENILRTTPGEILRFGGEFSLSWDGCSARDCYGVMDGPGPKGTVLCNGEVKGQIRPDVPELSLEDAIISAVELRSDEGVTALSGGVDSTLVAYLAGRECVTVGVQGAHDLAQARKAADTLGLSCTYVTLTGEEIEAALPLVIPVIPDRSPVNVGIAVTQVLHRTVGR